MPKQLNFSIPDDLYDDLKAYAASYNGVGISMADAARILLRKSIDASKESA